MKAARRCDRAARCHSFDMRDLLPYRLLKTVPVGLLLLGLSAAAPGASADDPVIPLPPDIAKDLALLGKGVVGKAVPAPTVVDVEKFLHAGGGHWLYKIVHGDTNQKIRVESYDKITAPGGGKAWKRTIGASFAEYIRLNADGSFGKYAEDDISVGYGAAMEPGIMLPAGLKPGDSKTIESKLKAYKMGHPHDIKYTGNMTSDVKYVGAYEITTPAGTWPALLIQSRFTVKIGPAKVSDTQYLLFAEGVGKVAEIETLKIAAMLVYHSNTKTAKVLTEAPRLAASK